MAVASLQQAQSAKVKKYAERCKNVDWNFVPAVCHLFGGWFGTGKTFVAKLLREVAKEERDAPHQEGTVPAAAELAYVMAHQLGKQLTITLDAGFHESRAPKRQRRIIEPTGETGPKRPRT